jgi:hypothetical protein
MKISYIAAHKKSQDYKRFSNYSSINEFDICENIESLKKDIKKCNEVLISDFISMKELFIIFILQKLYKKKIILWALELYSIDFKSLITEYKYARLESRLKKYYSAISMILRFILLKNLRYTELIVSSDERKNYIVDKIKCNKISVVYNYPMEIDDCSVVKTNRKINFEFDFYLCAGRINNVETLIKIADMISKTNLKILCVGSEVKLLHPSILNINFVSSDQMILYIKKAQKCICLYENRRINHFYSASSKLLEYIHLNKIIITNSNFGVIKTLEKYKYENFEVVS